MTANVWPLQRDCPTFYGNPSAKNWLHDNTTDVACPWPLFMDTTPVAHILIHKRCADSLARVLNNIWDAVGKSVSAIKALRYDRFSGSYNFRPIRGGHNLSMHSFAAAIDWDAEDNAQHDLHHLFKDDSLLVVKFKEESWIWGGDWSPGSVDAMHVQAARVHP